MIPAKARQKLEKNSRNLAQVFSKDLLSLLWPPGGAGNILLARLLIVHLPWKSYRAPFEPTRHFVYFEKVLKSDLRRISNRFSACFFAFPREEREREREGKKDEDREEGWEFD